MNAYIEWAVLGLGVTLLFGALFALLIVVAVKLRSRRGSGVTPPANPFVGESLRQRMEREDRDEAERVVNALYSAGRHLDNQAERESRMKNLAGSLKGMFGAPDPKSPPSA